MTKTEQKEIAKNILLSQLAIAHYQIEDFELYLDRGVKANDLTEENLNAIHDYINEYGKQMAKTIGGKYHEM